MKLLKLIIQNMPHFKEELDIDLLLNRELLRMIRENYIVCFPMFILIRLFHL